MLQVRQLMSSGNKWRIYGSKMTEMKALLKEVSKIRQSGGRSNETFTTQLNGYE